MSVKKGVSLKKRMFYSNMLIIFSALLALMVIIVGVLVFFEDSVEAQFHLAMEAAGPVSTETDWPEQALQQLFGTVVAAVILISMGAIGVVLLLAAFFTKLMNRRIMTPVELLAEGAQRIENGNLDEAIVYTGEKEFENVCQAFNGMQQTIRQDRQQRLDNERARIDMVTGISHDLRTPLTSIQGYIKGVLDGVADTREKQEMYLKTAYEATEEMNVLLQKLFDFSRMESGQMPFHMVRVDLAEYTAAYVAPSRLEISVTGVGETFPEISMDVAQVRRVFDNLLENSEKYAGVCPVRVDIFIREDEGGILLEWKDNGQGVADEKLSRIFDRFYRCDEARQEKGSGVGLYVVKYIMERHHGWVTAQNDGGLKICLYFPKEAKNIGKNTDCRG